MAVRIRPVALGIAALSAAIAAAGLRPVPVLQVENAACARTVRFPVGGDGFSITYHHSMYDAPVTEEFMLGPEGAILLEAVSSPSAAVREYFGITAAGERHAVVRSMHEVVFRVASGTPQRITAGGVERSFLELGEHGDRLVMRVARAPAFARWADALAASVR